MMMSSNKTLTSYILIGISALIMVSCDYEAKPEDYIDHQLLFPNDGETLIQGNTYKIGWLDDQSATMRIRLLKSGNIQAKISDEVLNTGKFLWTIPDTLEVDFDYSIKILSNDDDFIYYESKKPFKILKPGDTASFTDTRDWQVYKTVRLFDRWWMAENFNYDTIGSYCYDNNNMNCETHGRLYTRSSAISSCPPGWHLPSDDEWRTLEAYLGIPNLEINSIGFRGINAGYLLSSHDGVGFNAKYSGYLYYRNTDRFYSIGVNTYFWTSSFDIADSKYWVRQLLASSGGIERTKISGGQYAFSVRYIKDEE